MSRKAEIAKIVWTTSTVPDQYSKLIGTCKDGEHCWTDEKGGAASPSESFVISDDVTRSKERSLSSLASGLQLKGIQKFIQNFNGLWLAAQHGPSFKEFAETMEKAFPGNSIFVELHSIALK